MQLFTRVMAVQCVLLLFVGTAFAQFQTDWERTSRAGAENPAPSWIGAATERGMAYGVADGQERLYVASRSDGIQIRVLDANTGEDLTDVEFSMTGVSGGDQAINSIAVSDDGKVFVGNLSAGATEANPFKVYMWNDDEADPVLVVEYGGTEVRLGDYISVVGSVEDGSAVIYAAASNIDTVIKWAMEADTDNGGYVFQDEPTVMAGLPNVDPWGSPGYAIGRASGDDARFYAAGRSVTFVREYLADGSASTGFVEWPGTTLGRNVAAAEFVTVGDSEFLAVYAPLERRGALLALDADAADGVWTNKFDSLHAALPVMGETTENSFGTISTRVNEDGTITMFVLGTRNGIGSYTTTASFIEEPPYEPPASLIAYWHQNDNALSGGGFGFEEGDFPQPADLGAGHLTVGGGDILATDEDGVYEWLQSFAGTTLNALGDFEAGGSIALQGGTDTVNNGAWMQFEVSTVGFEDVILSFAARGTGTGFRDIQVSYSLDGDTFVDVGDSFDPVDGANFNVYTFEMPAELDHVETAYLRLTFNGATGENGNNRIDNIQVTGTPAEPPVDVIVWEEPEWAVRPGDVPWLQGTTNHMRGGAYNPATDHLLVTSRVPTLGVHILHPANGQTIGQLDVTGISGGTFALSEIAVTEDGQIFGANLHVDGVGIRIYRWENEDAAPELIWDGDLAARAGDSFFAAGSGDDVRVYISGTFNDTITMFQWDGETATIANTITPEATVDRARMGIAEGATHETLWINGPGTALAEVDAEDGEILREVSLDVLGTSYGDIAYFELDGRSYILAGSVEGSEAEGYTNKFVVVDVTEEGGEFRAYETPFLGIHENAFFIGWAAFDTKRNNALIGGTNVIVAAFSMAEHDNQAPTASDILTPADGAEITIEGDGETEFTATWSEATDPDDDTVLYTWQLSASPNFDELLVDANVGTETSFTTDFATVAGILDDAGVGFEGNITLYHRVVTSDGELTTTGSTSTVVLTRGTLTNVEPGIGLPTEFALHGNYPNPFNPTTNIRFDLPQSADVRVEVYDILGRQVMTMQHSMQAGANQTISVDAAHLASGTYLYRVVAEMQGATRIETGKMLLVK